MTSRLRPHNNRRRQPVHFPSQLSLPRGSGNNRSTHCFCKASKARRSFERCFCQKRKVQKVAAARRRALVPEHRKEQLLSKVQQSDSFVSHSCISLSRPTMLVRMSSYVQLALRRIESFFVYCVLFSLALRVGRSPGMANQVLPGWCNTQSSAHSLKPDAAASLSCTVRFLTFGAVHQRGGATHA